jgi:hypothetical protein
MHKPNSGLGIRLGNIMRISLRGIGHDAQQRGRLPTSEPPRLATETAQEVSVTDIPIARIRPSPWSTKADMCADGAAGARGDGPESRESFFWVKIGQGRNLMDNREPNWDRLSCDAKHSHRSRNHPCSLLGARVVELRLR